MKARTTIIASLLGAGILASGLVAGVSLLSTPAQATIEEKSVLDDPNTVGPVVFLDAEHNANYPVERSDTSELNIVGTEGPETSTIAPPPPRQR